jgi:TrmH family RNA methyltransferase
MPSVITSLHNERVKLVRALQEQAKTRRKEGKVVLEGARLITDALECGFSPIFALYTEDLNPLHASLLGRLGRVDVPTSEVSREVLAHMTDTDTPQGVLAVVPTPYIAPPERITLALVLDGIADPGNMGTILRTAGAAGVDVVALLPGCVDPFNPKVLRSGMGAHFRVALLHYTWAQIGEHLGALMLCTAEAGGSVPYYTVDWRQPTGLIIGGETRGVSDASRRAARAAVSIPMANEAESLNAAMAAAVILFEARRQRIVG